MKFKKIFSYFGDSLKDIEMNKILDKLHKKFTLTSKEKKFLDIYSQSSGEDKDLMYLSKNTTFKKIKDFISRGKKVICDLHDRDGKIGLEIKDATNNIEEEDCIIILKDNTTHKLHDKFLYNLIHYLIGNINIIF